MDETLIGLLDRNADHAARFEGRFDDVQEPDERLVHKRVPDSRLQISPGSGRPNPSNAAPVGYRWVSSQSTA